MKTEKYDISGLICLWALAESGIGGVLHALKLPFTGIFVGGFAVLSICLIAWYSTDKKEILKALSIVLAVKLLASPHSPWQAYVAVAFQGLLGYILLHQRKNFAVRTFIFAILCMLESALQKIILAFLIFGTDFFDAIDKAAVNFALSLGMDLNASLVNWVFMVYTFLHLLTGLALGWWIPSLPSTIEGMAHPPKSSLPATRAIKAKKMPSWVGLTLVLIGGMALIYAFLPEGLRFNVLYLLVRVVLITLALTFLIGPLVKKLILKYLSRNQQSDTVVRDVLNRLPAYKNKLIEQYSFASQNYKGLAIIKVFILGMLVFSLKGDDVTAS